MDRARHILNEACKLYERNTTDVSAGLGDIYDEREKWRSVADYLAQRLAKLEMAMRREVNQ